MKRLKPLVQVHLQEYCHIIRKAEDTNVVQFQFIFQPRHFLLRPFSFFYVQHTIHSHRKNQQDATV
jgi:hypothetical protein